MAEGYQEGVLTLLRVQDPGTQFGPPTDQIDVEVVGVIDTGGGSAFGFQLRDDGNRPAREGMLAILRDAFNNGYRLTIKFETPPRPKENVVAYAAWISK